MALSDIRSPLDLVEKRIRAFLKIKKGLWTTLQIRFIIGWLYGLHYIRILSNSPLLSG